MPTSPEDFIAQLIHMWEGGYQNYRSDTGNWVVFPDGHMVDVGTNFGVTPNALAAHRRVKPYTVTESDMRSLSVDEAIDIGIQHYYKDVKMDMLTWGPTTAAIVDFGWNSGPGTAIMHLQRILRCAADGAIGPVTAGLYDQWIVANGWRGSLKIIHDDRQRFIDQIVANNPDNEQFRQGWYNRNDWASADNDEWWDQWDVNT